MGTTSRGYPYPGNSDNVDVPGDIQALADALNTDIAAVIAALKTKHYKKTADTSRSSTTTMANDPHLVNMALGVGLWRVQAVLFMSGAAAADFRHQFTFSGTATPDYSRLIQSPESATTDVRATLATSIQATQFGVANIGTDGVRVGAAYEDMLLEVTVAGNLTLQWCQAVSSATATVLYTGSRIYVSPLI
jgi:hypothetical protein